MQADLQRWLGDLIEVQSVEVQNDDATLNVRVKYIVRRSQTPEVAEFTQTGTGS
jgi:hypothetical protein